MSRICASEVTPRYDSGTVAAMTSAALTCPSHDSDTSSASLSFISCLPAGFLIHRFRYWPLPGPCLDRFTDLSRPCSGPGFPDEESGRAMVIPARATGRGVIGPYGWAPGQDPAGAVRDAHVRERRSPSSRKNGTPEVASIPA
ncbi:hypothetical protein GCM10009530_00720 [Microbispora corallina]|uniref:Uncharacterized protein n=1 Tax=Microbispora corallina TaxID=83302 RepID=A0ABQ4FS99_9ACTN|nr:hypothetical protein Mco01_07000 [Microbispora corallina]